MIILIVRICKTTSRRKLMTEFNPFLLNQTTKARESTEIWVKEKLRERHKLRGTVPPIRTVSDYRGTFFIEKFTHTEGVERCGGGMGRERERERDTEREREEERGRERERERGRDRDR